MNKSLAFSLSLLVIGTVSSVQAQNVLEEITVTAQKRAQSAQDIGISVATLTGQQLRDENIVDTADVARNVPNVDMFDPTGGGVPVIIIRGVGLQNFRVNDTPTTAFYIDEVYQTSVAMAGFTMFDLERLEILRGPQGGLYGRNAVGGAVQVISAKPSMEDSSGYAELMYGKYNRLSLEAAYGGKLSDTTAYRVAGRVLNSGNTFYRSVSGGFKHGDVSTWAARGQLLFTPSESSEFLFKLHGGSDNSETPLLRAAGVYNRFGMNIVPDFADGALFNYAGVNRSLESVCPAILSGGRDDTSCETVDGRTPVEQGVLGVHDSDSNFPSRLNNKWWGASLIARFWFGDYELTSISAYDDFEHGRLVDFDGVETVQQHIDYSSDIDAWSQEFRLARDADKYNWIVGFNVAEDKFKEYSFLEGTSGLVPLAFGGLTQATQSYDQKTKMISGYGHAEYFLTDSTALIGELRYTQEKKSFVGGVALNQVAPDYFISYTDDKKTFSDWSGKITLEHTLGNGNLLYGTISQGFKSGGFFGGFATSDSALAPFDNEKMTAYEVGFKSEMLEQTLRINGAVFYYDRSDIQASATDPTETVPVKRLQNIGDGRTWGGELEATWLASQYFRLHAGLGYLNTEITDSDLLVLDIYSSGTHSMEGARMPNTPSWSGNLVATYDRPISDKLSADISLEYSGRTDQDLTMVVLEEERPVLEEGAYSLVNIRANLRSLNGNWHVGVFVENLFDEDYRTTARSDTLGGIYELYGSPRIWGISLGTQF